MFNLTKKQKNSESYKYIANSISDISEKMGKKTFALTSSFCGNYKNIAENIFDELTKRKENVLLINAEISPEKNKFIGEKKENNKMRLINAEKEELQNLLQKENSYNIVLIVIPPVIMRADALEYAKVCENVILIEKYMHSKYKDYENTILALGRAGVNIEGVITYK